MDRSETILPAETYAMFREGLTRRLIPIPPDMDAPHLFREAEGSKPTGRWFVLAARHDTTAPAWEWPPVADNPNTNAATAKFQ